MSTICNGTGSVFGRRFLFDLQELLSYSSCDLGNWNSILDLSTMTETRRHYFDAAGIFGLQYWKFVGLFHPGMSQKGEYDQVKDSNLLKNCQRSPINSNLALLKHSNVFVPYKWSYNIEGELHVLCLFPYLWSATTPHNLTDSIIIHFRTILSGN